MEKSKYKITVGSCLNGVQSTFILCTLFGMLTPGIGFRAGKFIVINTTQIVFCKLNGRVSVLFNKLLHSNAYLSNRFFCRIFRIKLINRFSLIRDGRRRALNVLIFLKVRSRWLPIGTGESNDGEVTDNKSSAIQTEC